MLSESTRFTFGMWLGCSGKWLMMQFYTQNNSPMKTTESIASQYKELVGHAWATQRLGGISNL